MNNIICLIPARFHSSRLPGKPLLLINNKTIIQRTYDNVIKSKYFNRDNIIVVTDDARIADTVSNFNGRYRLIKDTCINGTERIVKLLPDIDEKNIIVNVQGDEPFINPKHIDDCVSCYLDISDNDKKKYACSTLHYKILDKSELSNKNVGKLVTDKDNNIIYCSRSMIPHNKQGDILDIDYYGHIGIFVFNRNILEYCFNNKNTPNQLSEDIEWLKFIEYGYKIKSCKVENSEIGVNTQEDYEFLLQKYDANYKKKIRLKNRIK